MSDTSPPAPPCVLVVDDDERIRKVVQARLDDAGFRTRGSNTGESALAECRDPARRPDLVILDVMMPGRDGFEICRDLKSSADTRGITVVLLTALDGPDERARGLAAGAEDFLTKPFSGAELVARVRSLLGPRRLDRLAEQRATLEALVPEGPAVERAGGANVLLVEDERMHRGLYGAWLREDGHAVREASTVAEALSAVGDGGFDLILLDILLPDGDGREIVRHVRSLPDLAETPVVIVTSLGDTQEKVLGLEAGADDYLVKPIDSAELRARVAIQLRRRAAMNRLSERLRAAAWRAVTDSLTGTYGRSFFDAHLRQQVAFAQRYQRPLSVLMLDIDHFKRVNDAMGHLAGDEVIRGVAERLRKRLRLADVLCRYGGEEFAVILPETGGSDAMRTAEELRALVSSAPFLAHRTPVPITVSIGVAAGRGGSPEALVAAADRALYRAKSLGRNRVEMGVLEGWSRRETAESEPQ